MKEIILSTRNKHKVEEIQKLLPSDFRLLSLSDVGFDEEIPEPYFTFEENALHKARVVFEKTNKPVIADDSGLMVLALNGAPGVLSARFAGPGSNDQLNVEKLLNEMKANEIRDAEFKCAMALVSSDTLEKVFIGSCKGKIAKEPTGNNGFGYDPVFIPTGFNETFGSLDNEIKNRISHRAQAMAQLISYLRK